MIDLKKPKVYVTRQLFEKAVDLLKKHADIEVFEGEDNPVPREVLLKKVKKVDGLLCLLTDKIDTEVLDAGKNLRVVSNYAVGFNNIDIAEATKRGVYVANTSGILTETTADCAFALMMCIARRIAEADRHTRNGGWIHAWGPKMFLGSDIHGKTLGILGMGRIGTALTKRAKGFGMNVIYYDNIRRRDLEDELGIKYYSFRVLLKKSDFVSIHVPLTDATYHMIGERELSSMKKTAFLINTARGPIVAEEALYHALKNKLIAGAGIDVFEKEPIDKDNPILKLDNIVITPHIASASIDTRTNMAVLAATNLIDVLEGRVPTNLVNPDVVNVRPL